MLAHLVVFDIIVQIEPLLTSDNFVIKVCYFLENYETIQQYIAKAKNSVHIEDIIFCAKYKEKPSTETHVLKINFTLLTDGGQIVKSKNMQIWPPFVDSDSAWSITFKN